MNDPARMREAHGVADFLKNDEQRGERIFGERVLVPRFQLAQHVVQRRALHEFHRVEEPSLLVGAHVVNGHDVRMRELPEHAGLLQETLFLLLAGLPAQHHLHRHTAPKLRVPRVQHGPHAAARDLTTGTVG